MLIKTAYCSTAKYNGNNSAALSEMFFEKRTANHVRYNKNRKAGEEETISHFSKRRQP